MVGRVSAPTLGGAGVGTRAKRSGWGRFRQVAGGLSQLGDIWDRRRDEARRTMRMDSKASLHESMVALDADPSTQGIDFGQKSSMFDDLIEASVAGLAEHDKEGAATQRLQGSIWKQSFLADDRKASMERQAAEALDIRARVLDQSRSDLFGAAEGLLDVADANAPTRAAAMMGSVKERYEEAIADLPPGLQAEMRREFSYEAARMATAAWLSKATDPVAAYERLRSNQDEWQLPDGTTFNLSGPLDDAGIERTIQADMARRSSAYTMGRQARLAQQQAEDDRTEKALNQITARVRAGDLSMDQALELAANPNTPQDVAEGIESFIHTRHARNDTNARHSRFQLDRQDRWLRAIDGADSEEDVDELRQAMLNDHGLADGMVSTVLTAARQKDEDLARSRADGTLVEDVSFATHWQVWTSRAEERVQGGAVSDRIGLLETNPSAKAFVTSELAELERTGKSLIKNSPSTAPFLEVVMPLAVEQVYERAIEGAGQNGREARYTADSFRQLMQSIGSREGMKALADGTQKQLVGLLADAGVLSQRTAGYFVMDKDDPDVVDVDETLIRWERAERDALRTPRPRTVGEIRRSVIALGKAQYAAQLAANSPKWSKDVAIEMAMKGATFP